MTIKSIKPKHLLILIAIVILISALVLVLIALKNNSDNSRKESSNITLPESILREEPFYISLPESFPSSYIANTSTDIGDLVDNGSDTQGEVYRDENIQLVKNFYSGFKLYSLKSSPKKEIFNWEEDSGYGVGGISCPKILYTSDRRYFVACISIAEAVEYQMVPIIFDSDGNLIANLGEVSGFPVKSLKHSKDRTYQSGESFIIADGYIEFGWLDNNTLGIIAYNNQKTEHLVYSIADKELKKESFDDSKVVLDEYRNPLNAFNFKYTPIYHFEIPDQSMAMEDTSTTLWGTIKTDTKKLQVMVFGFGKLFDLTLKEYLDSRIGNADEMMRIARNGYLGYRYVFNDNRLLYAFSNGDTYVLMWLDKGDIEAIGEDVPLHESYFESIVNSMWINDEW